MAFRTFNSILDECLDAVQQGESVEKCLSRYPDQADRLRPLLTLAETIQKTPLPAPRPWPQSTAWHRVRQRAAELRVPRRGAPQLNLSLGAWMRPIVITVAIVAALFGTVGGTALAAQNALPDSPLYRVKLATEEVRLLLVFDDVREAEILIDQSNERMDEILTMTRQDKEIPGNVLSALRSRNERASEILTEHPEEADLLATLVQQSESQEGNLILLFPAISESAYDDYTKAVAAVHNARLPTSAGLVGIQPEELSDGVLHISGAAQQVGPGLWNVGGLEVRVDETTIGASALQPGSTARLVVGKNSRGQYRALSLSTLQPELPPSGSVVSGEVEEVTADGIKIAGQFIPFNSDTFRKGKIKPGQRVKITLSSSQLGVAAATVQTEAAEADSADLTAPFSFEGVLRGDVRKSNEWEIGGLKFVISSSTNVEAQAGEAKEGARVLVEASNQDGKLLAQTVTVLAIESSSESAYAIGTFEDSEDGVWFVSGLELVPPVRTAEPAPGTLLALELRRQGNDLEVQSTTVIQEPDETGLVRLAGTITQIDGAFWTLDFATVRVASTADFSGPEAVAGARALVWGRRNQNGVFEATYARVLDSKSVIATPTPAPEEAEGD